MAFFSSSAELRGPRTAYLADSVGGMPVISVFFGIVIRMYYEDHDPPHIHAEHQGHRAKVDFDGRVIAGAIGSAMARRRIAEWAKLNRPALEANWQRMRAGRPLERVKPLD